MAPPDPIIGLNEAYQKDDYPQKVIVGVGAYRDDKGKPYVLPCVREAEKRIMEANVVSFACCFVEKLVSVVMSSTTMTTTSWLLIPTRRLHLYPTT